MHRAIHYSRRTDVLKCPNCYQQISASLLAPYLERRLLDERGTRPMFRHADVVPGDKQLTRRLEHIDDALRKAATSLTDDGANIRALNGSIARLKQERGELRRRTEFGPVRRPVPTGDTVAEIWRRCTSDLQRRDVLAQ